MPITPGERQSALKYLRDNGLTFYECIVTFGVETSSNPYTKTATQLAQDGHIEFDEHTVLSESEDGNYVLAWIWVGDEEIEQANDPAEDARDAEIARQRLAEIEADPSKLVTGTALATVLDQTPAEPRTMTLVFEINDMAAFERDHPNIKALAMRVYQKGLPYAVRGMSVADEIRRYGMIRDVLDRVSDREEAVDTIREILELWEPAEFDAYPMPERRDS